MRALLAPFLVMVSGTAAQAHSAERGFVLLLPTGNVIVAGAAAVAVSFLVLLFVSDRWVRGLLACEMRLGHLPLPPIRLMSLASLALLVLLIWAGFMGSRDPLENPLTLAVWTLWWVVIVLLHPVFGNLWAGLTPFAWVKAREQLVLPAYVPALIIFAGFAWFQLVSARPEDPAVLALAALIYLALGFAGVLAFGTKPWLERGDPFSVFLRLLGATAPVRRSDDGTLFLRVPGTGLVGQAPLPMAGVLFVLLTLSSVSFDGFANTFTWLSWGGINPLDFPGRTAVMGHNTLGLAGSFAALAALYGAAVAIGWMMAGKLLPLSILLGRFVYSLIPISIAFHFAHYLSEALLNGQYLLVALGLQYAQPTASFLNTASGALAIYTVQTLAIVAGHVMGVAVGHVIALDVSGQRALRLEAPLAVLMVLYTAFGLWTLSAPAIG